LPLAFGATVLIKAWNPDLQPNMAGAPSVQTVFLLDTVFFEKVWHNFKNICCSRCSFQRFAQQKLSFYISL
jgi:hypothetical protein